MIDFFSSSRYKFNKKYIKDQINQYLIDKNLVGNFKINVVFVGKIKMKKIALTYKNEDIALPVLSFLYNEKINENEILLGEIFICYPQAILLAAERNKKVDDTLVNLIKHGIDNLLKN